MERCKNREDCSERLPLLKAVSYTHLNYDHLIFEEGVQLVDMVYLKKEL